MSAEEMAARAGLVLAQQDPHARWRRAKRHRVAVEAWERGEQLRAEQRAAAAFGVSAAREDALHLARECGYRAAARVLGVNEVVVRVAVDLAHNRGWRSASGAARRSDPAAEYGERAGGPLLAVGGRAMEVA